MDMSCLKPRFSSASQRGQCSPDNVLEEVSLFHGGGGKGRPEGLSFQPRCLAFSNPSLLPCVDRARRNLLHPQRISTLTYHSKARSYLPRASPPLVVTGT
eukprot:214821-Amphidinium_carterae.1